jgi:enhancing lycopene biosynthesis protein 2
MSKKVAVILSGCGVYDGAEIHESVITLLRLDQRGAQVQCFAPNIAQIACDQPPDRRRNARVAQRAGGVGAHRPGRSEGHPRGQRRRLRCADRARRFGAAKNLSNFAVEGAAAASPDVLALAEAFAEAGKPVGLICISPALAAKIYGPGVICTIGNDAGTAPP